MVIITMMMMTIQPLVCLLSEGKNPINVVSELLHKQP